MRPKGLGLIAALVVAMMAPATLSHAQKAPKIDAGARKTGMADAPAVIAASGIACQLSDARFLGESQDPKTKAKSKFYEVACAPGSVGYIMQYNGSEPPTTFSCIEANTPPAPGQKPSAPCILPGNDNPAATLAPMLAKAGTICTPTEARGIGQTKTNVYLEVACQEGRGYVVIGSSPLDPAKTVEAQDCLNFDDGDGNVKCILSDKAKRLAVVDSYVAAANNGCVIKDRGFIGTAKDGSNYYEASCQDGKGYIYKADAKGAFGQAIDCAKASAILGGCKLTDSRAAETEQAGLYTRLAKAAGSNCEVTKYAIFPTGGTDDIVELVCSNGSGGVGIFKSGGKGEVLSCAHALVAGYKCGINTDNGFAALTADLRKFNQNSCTVSASRVVGKTAKGTMLMEVACSDGLKGYVIEYSTNPVTAVGSTGCAFAGGCKLPGNT